MSDCYVSRGITAGLYWMALAIVTREPCHVYRFSSPLELAKLGMPEGLLLSFCDYVMHNYRSLYPPPSLATSSPLHPIKHRYPSSILSNPHPDHIPGPKTCYAMRKKSGNSIKRRNPCQRYSSKEFNRGNPLPSRFDVNAKGRNRCKNTYQRGWPRC
jgi:hypothetical protein